MANPEKKFIDISKKPKGNYGILSSRFAIVDIDIAIDKTQSRRLSLVNCKVELNFTGSMSALIGNQPISGDITLYSNLNGYDKNTSLLYQIEGRVNKKDFNDLISPITIYVTVGYLGLNRGTDYKFAAKVYKITSSKDEGKRTQSWKFDVVEGGVYNNNFASIFKKSPRKFLKEPKEGEEQTKYIDILKYIYTPLGTEQSMLDDPLSTLVLDDDLTQELNKPIHDDYAVNFAATQKNNGQSFQTVVKDFWNFTKSKGAPLEGKAIVNKFTRKIDDKNPTGRVRLSLTNVEETKSYYLLDDSKIKDLPYTEDAYFAVECLFDPSVFIHDGVVVLTRYFSSLITPTDLGLLTTGTSVVIDRNSDLYGANLTNLPIWYIVSYDISFNNTSSSPCMMTLYLSRQLIPSKVT